MRYIDWLLDQEEKQKIRLDTINQQIKEYVNIKREIVGNLSSFEAARKAAQDGVWDDLKIKEG